MRLTIKVSSIIEQSLILAVLILVFLYDVFSNVLGFFDELIGLFSFVVIFYYLAVKGRVVLYRKEYYILVLLALIITIGLVSNMWNNYNGNETHYVAVFADLINFSKAFVVYFALRFLQLKFDSSLVLKRIAYLAEVIFYVLLVFILIDVIFKIYPRAPRYGINSIELFFRHGSRYAFAFSFIFLVLLPKYYKTKPQFLLFILLIGLLSFRVKYFGFLILCISFMTYGKRLFRVPKLYFFSTLSILGLVMLWLFREKIIEFFTFEDINDAWSRAVVLYYSFIIGNDFFPLGTGFGSFSSYYSGAYYSWVYDKYGISNVYGISRLYWKFVADQYWPMILGQFGYLGLLSMIGVIYNYLSLFLSNIKSQINSKTYFFFLSAILGMFMLIIDSTSDSIFSQQRAVVMFAYFALIMNIYRTSNESTTSK